VPRFELGVYAWPIGEVANFVLAEGLLVTSMAQATFFGLLSSLVVVEVGCGPKDIDLFASIPKAESVKGAGRPKREVRRVGKPTSPLAALEGLCSMFSSLGAMKRSGCLKLLFVRRGSERDACNGVCVLLCPSKCLRGARLLVARAKLAT
jgi:hypothetical protein